MPKITKTEVDKAQPETKSYFVWDSDLKGFGLLVLPSGIKSFVYQYRNAEGQSRRITLGKHSSAFTAGQARKAAQQRQRDVLNGIDPLGEKRGKRNAMKMAALFDLYLGSARFKEKAPSTQGIDRGRINRHLAPTLGKHFVHKLTAEDVRAAFSAIRDGKTKADEHTGPRGRAIVKGGEGTARMAVRLLRAILRWAIHEGYTSTNAAENVEIGTDGSRKTVIHSATEYSALFKTLEQMQNEKRIRDSAADSIRVIALTGARRGEIAGVRWRHVDLKKGVIELPPKEHKTGKKTAEARIIGLPAAAQAIIARQPEGQPDDLVFRPAKGEGVISLSAPWRKVRKEAGLPPEMGLHGLRHSLATAMAMNGAEAAEMMAVLGHKQLTTVQRYIHMARDARAEMAERAAGVALAGLGASSAEVLPLPRGQKVGAKKRS